MLRLGKEILILDGAMGSETEKLGLSGVQEDLNITCEEQIKAIHRAYSCADIATTNTFGLNAIKYKGAYALKEVALKAIENARCSGRKVFFDIGPTGAMLAPVGTLTFDRAYGVFSEIVEITKEYVDGYILETFSDLYEIKACMLAVKEHTDKPVFATMTFDSSHRTLTGSTPEIVACTLEGLGADAVGANCSAGPDELADVIKRMLSVTSLPVIVQPNCGMPEYRDGKTVYPLSAEEFAKKMKVFVDAGVSAIGGCCGTSPEHIRAISKYAGRKVASRTVKSVTAVNSSVLRVVLDGVCVCGERLNPTGKKKLKEAVKDGDYNYLLDEAVKQTESGADLLDVNVGVPGVDEAEVMRRTVEKVQEYVNLPLQIDSSDPKAIEAGVRYYNGIPLINSVNGDKEVMERIFPVAKKYGAVVIGLTLDKDGVPDTAEKRFEIAKRIVGTAQSFGIPKNRIIIDTLTLTASAEQKLVNETLKAVTLVKTLGVKTALGVSNVSFGLPERGILNRTFLTCALAHGLNMPIMNPLDEGMMSAVRAYRVLSGEDKNSEAYIGVYGGERRNDEEQKAEECLYSCVERGLTSKVEYLTEKELETKSPEEVTDGILIKALNDVGKRYEEGKIFLPRLISCAECAKKAFDIIGERLPKGSGKRGKVVLATVKNDVHDIGKNIVKVVASSYGYEVIDLGKDVPEEEVVKAYLKHMPVAIGLSALMTTTVKSMEETVKALKEAGCSCAIYVGGAVLNQETADRMGAIYTPDALSFVRSLDELISSSK